MARYFKLETANKKDYEQLMWLLQNKTFYPEATSTPSLPGSYSAVYDYRQFFRYIAQYAGMPVVKTREDKSAAQFGVSYVPTAEWTTRYGLSAAPTIVELSDEFEYVNGRPVTTTADVFLVYHYGT